MFKRLREWRRRRRILRAIRLLDRAYPGAVRIFMLDNHGMLIATGCLRKFLTIS